MCPLEVARHGLAKLESLCEWLENSGFELMQQHVQCSAARTASGLRAVALL
jgi:hypothetical protein